ncbi:MAG: ferrous iron transport protein A [Bacteroidota bacterium]
MNLAQITPGNSAKIKAIANHELGAKLIEMGLFPGKEVRVIFRAPFKGPFAIDAGGAVLSLRENEAELIETEAVAP